MKTKLVRVGKEHAVVVDPALLEKLGIESDSELEIAVEDGCLVITKAGTRRREEPGPAKGRLPRPPKPPQRPTPREPKYGFPKKQPW